MAKTIYHDLFEKDSVFTFNDRILPGLEMKGSDYKAKYGSFKTITFKDTVYFEDTDLSIGLEFEDCVFEGPLVFKDIIANGYDGLLNPNSVNLSFKNCTFNNIVRLTGEKSKIERAVKFINSNFNDDLTIEGLSILIESISIEYCTIEKRLFLSNLSVKQSVTLRQNTINSNVRIDALNCQSFAIVGDNIFNEDFYIYGCDFNSGLIFNNGKFKKEFYIRLIKSQTNGLTIIGAEFERSVFVNFHDGKSKPLDGFSEFYFSDSKFKNGIYIDGTEELISDLPTVNKIELVLTAELQGDIVFRNLNMGILSMSGYNNANILLKHLFVNQIRINNLINNAGLILSGIKSSYTAWYNQNKIVRENAIYIDDSNFGKAQFYQTDLSSFSKVIFHNNILTEISTSLVKWFTPEQLDEGRSSLISYYNEIRKLKDNEKLDSLRKSVISTLRSKQEIYRQLKFVSQRQGDMPGALEYQRHEMNYYKNINYIRKPRKWNELIIMWSNQSNDFGQNWLKALRLLLLFSFITYIPIGMLNTDKLNYSEFATSWSDIVLNFEIVFLDNIHNWIITLNPIHRLQDFNEDIAQLSKMIYLWDILSRLVVSYFIFQLVSAFRKFNK